MAVAAQHIADIVANLTRLGAVVIAFDVIFAEPDRLNPDVAAEHFRDLDEATRDKLRELPSNDQIFADAIRHSRVVLGESGVARPAPISTRTLPVTGLATLGEDPAAFMFKFPGLLRNVKVMEKAAAGRGLLTIVPERDGIVRRVPMILRAQGNAHALAELRDPAHSRRLRHHHHQGRQVRHREHRAAGPPAAMPTDSQARFWVHFARNDPSIYVSAVDVLDGASPPERSRRSWC